MKRSWLWLGAGVVVLAFLYLPTLGVSVGQILGFLLVLACPLMHFLGGHRHGGADAKASAPPPAESAPRPSVSDRDQA
ncbi:MAG: DUF2933 domain-containing protein [Candidatus Rokubacteria bacterium]|nr:DUF2933 domain-containing protein [Candidatus Rokubacteria bacterium]MBI4254886.1 DUF2933 domain-containing protein [Candidatus Rokubacteria bacterium]MBI4627408.1 DUF2933 domain-containing protein [Candidatus Rokubacteria bacterium]